ncbi:MAG: hypothetical protein IPF93_00120 [Saprospiraceae bacterium]|nr:hypothetical protein [Saprospiraceae bacterium]
MYRMSFFLSILFFISCDKDEAGQSVCYTLIERQCAMDPYNAYFKDIKNADDRIRAIKDYLQDKEISPVNITANPLSMDAVCLACICPNGYSYRLTLEVKDTIRLLALDLLLVHVDCAK